MLCLSGVRIKAWYGKHWEEPGLVGQVRRGCRRPVTRWGTLSGRADLRGRGLLILTCQRSRNQVYTQAFSPQSPSFLFPLPPAAFSLIPSICLTVLPLTIPDPQIESPGEGAAESLCQVKSFFTKCPDILKNRQSTQGCMPSSVSRNPR